MEGDGTPDDSTVNEWQDYSGASPGSSLSHILGTSRNGPVEVRTKISRPVLIRVE
jgi:hypothetical protein